MNKALAIYSNRAAKDDDFEEWKRRNEHEDIILPPFDTVLSESKEIVNELRFLTNDFTEISKSEAGLQQTLELIRKYNSNLNVLKQFTPDEVDVDFEQLDPTKLDQLIPVLGLTPDEEEN